MTARAKIWVCGACGKTSPDKTGGKGASRGWDVSCMMNSVLCWVDSLVYGGENGKVVKANAEGCHDGEPM